MDKHQSEKLSAVSDGEAIYDDVMSRLVASNKDFQEQWKRIHIIRDVMRGQSVSIKAQDLSLRVSQALENEPTILAMVFAVSYSLATISVLKGTKKKW